MTITVGELALIRAAQDSYMPDSCMVQSATKSRSTVGGTTVEWSTGAAYRCRLSPAKEPQKYVAADRLGGGRVWWVTLPHDANVDAGDRIVVGALTLSVVGVETGKSYLTALRALCEEVL